MKFYSARHPKILSDTSRSEQCHQDYINFVCQASFLADLLFFAPSQGVTRPARLVNSFHTKAYYLVVTGIFHISIDMRRDDSYVAYWVTCCLEMFLCILYLLLQCRTSGPTIHHAQNALAPVRGTSITASGTQACPLASSTLQPSARLC